MRQDTTSALSDLASFAKLQDLLAARSNAGCGVAKMTFEAFEVELGQAVRGLENELKATDLARYDVDADAVMVDGQEWRKCLEQQPKTYLGLDQGTGHLASMRPQKSQRINDGTD